MARHEKYASSEPPDLPLTRRAQFETAARSFKAGVHVGGIAAEVDARGRFVRRSWCAPLPGPNPSVTSDSGTQPASGDERVSALASTCALAWIIAVGALANAVAVSPPGNRVSEINAWIHSTQHGVIVGASVLIGAGLRDLARSGPWSTPLRLVVGAAGVAVAAAALLPALHPLRHGVLAAGGAVMGVALRDALLARGRGRAASVADIRRSRLKPYAPGVYTPGSLQHWRETGRRQEAKDRVLLPEIARAFVPGRVLELGAGAGQTSLILRDLGWEVVASDYAQFFVEHLQSLGLPAHRVDATDIAASQLGRFANVFCQSVTPLITSDLDVVEQSYRSIREALEPGGRLVEIHAQAARHELRSTMRLHAEQARSAGFRDVRVVRNQLLPSRAYRRPLRPVAALAERALGRHFGSRFVLTARRERG
jgi:SAM-dependent methyltransferase